MSTRSNSKSLSDRKTWNTIFESMVEALGKQHTQLETLFNERKILKSRIELQSQRWEDDMRLYQDHISQLQRSLVTEDLANVHRAAKWDMLSGLMNRKSNFCQLKLDHAEDELADFRSWFHLLTQNPNPCLQDHVSLNNRAITCKEKAGSQDDNSILVENSREKNSEVSVLLREKEIVRDEFKRMETELTNKLTIKETEIQQLKLSNQEKDQVISRLETKVEEMEGDAKKRNEEISRLTKEIETLRKGKMPMLVTPLSQCTTQSRTSNLVDKNKGSRNLKRGRSIDIIRKSETPKLFTSSFKVPKLKYWTPQALPLS